MNRFSIKDIENLTGIKAHTIRIWEQRYGILQSKRTPTNIRYYDADDLKIALRIALLNSYGYKISRIHKMTEEEMISLIGKVADNELKLQALVNELLEATLKVDIEMFEELIDQYSKKNGIERTVEDLIFLYLEKIGLMWMSDRIFPAQEHLVSNVIYRKLAVAIEQLPVPEDKSGPVLLFLPEGEIHDLALLYVCYILRKRGKHTIYLGADTPIKEAKFVYEAKQPDHIYMHLTSIVEDFDGNKYLQKLAEEFPKAKFLVSGAMLQGRKYNRPSNMKFLHSLEEARNALMAL